MFQVNSILYTSSSTIPVTNLKPNQSNQKPKSNAHFTPEAVIVTISPEAQRLQREVAISQDKPVEKGDTPSKQNSEAENTSKPKQASDRPSEIDPEAERLLQRLKQTDLKVRTHERQHVAAAAGYVKNGPVYEYSTGPDGKKYAVGGHVSLDMSPIPNNPKATIKKAQIIKRAALAPADPSAADRAVAASAAKMEQKARRQLQEEQDKTTAAANTKGFNSKVNSYTQSHYQPGGVFNILL